jgi:hypothetical protein
MFKENDLRELLSILDPSGPSLNGRFDPLWVIKAVNTLQPLGKDKAVAAVQEFQRVAPIWLQDSADLIFVLRLLFEVPKDPGYMPGVWGRLSLMPRPPDDPKRIPRFPIVIMEDIPLDVAFFVLSTGQQPSLAAHVRFYRQRGNIRARPLCPTNKPLEVYPEFLKAYGWLYTNWQDRELGLSFVKDQFRALLRTVYRGDIENRSLPRPIRWDTKLNIYSFLDGTILPERSVNEATK